MLPFAQLGPSPNKPKSHGKHFKQKVSGCKTFGVFHKQSLPKNQFWTEPIRPFSGHCNSFCGVTHNCFTTVISSCSCSMKFYNGFSGPTTWPPKNKFIWKFLWFFDLVVIHPLLAIATWAEQSLPQCSSNSQSSNNHQNQTWITAVKGMFFHAFSLQIIILCILCYFQTYFSTIYV